MVCIVSYRFKHILLIGSYRFKHFLSFISVFRRSLDTTQRHPKTQEAVGRSVAQTIWIFSPKCSLRATHENSNHLWCNAAAIVVSWDHGGIGIQPTEIWIAASHADFIRSFSCQSQPWPGWESVMPRFTANPGQFWCWAFQVPAWQPRKFTPYRDWSGWNMVKSSSFCHILSEAPIDSTVKSADVAPGSWDFCRWPSHATSCGCEVTRLGREGHEMEGYPKHPKPVGLIWFNIVVQWLETFGGTTVLEATIFTLHYTRLHYITLPTLHYTRTVTPLQYDCNYTTLFSLHHNYNFTTLQLRLQLHHTTLHPAVVGEVTTATTFRLISGFALPSVIHNNQPLLEVSYSETSATALCGTTGMIYHEYYDSIN